MFGSASLALRVGGALAAGAFVAAAAGCASSSSAPAAHVARGLFARLRRRPLRTSATSRGIGRPAAVGLLTGRRGTATATGGATGGGATACATNDLSVKVGTSEGAAGSIYQVIDFTNGGSAPCTLYGYPGVSLAAGSPAAQVGAAATRSTTAAATVVTLAPGATANALLRVTQALNYPTVDVHAQGDHGPARLPAEPDGGGRLGLQVDRVRVVLGEAADDRRGAAGREHQPVGPRAAAARRELGGRRRPGRGQRPEQGA